MSRPLSPADCRQSAPKLSPAADLARSFNTACPRCAILRRSTEVQMRFNLNRQSVEIPDELSDEPLLFVLRDHFELNGPRFGCGVGSCGACAVVIDGEAQRSCVYPTAAADGRQVLTLEGLAEGDNLHPVQQAWID